LGGGVEGQGGDTKSVAGSARRGAGRRGGFGRVIVDEEGRDSTEARGSERRELETGDGVCGGRHDVGDSALGKGHGRCLHIPPVPGRTCVGSQAHLDHKAQSILQLQLTSISHSIISRHIAK
jgi:hypothetical protein